MTIQPTQTVSLIIPSRGRSLKLQNLVDSIASQEIPEGWGLETLIIIDGEGEPPICPPKINAGVHAIGHAGAGNARNEGIRRSSGEILVFLNDDVVLQPGFIAAHVGAIRAGHKAAVGHAPWKPPGDPTLFDAFVACTPAIFAQSSLVPGGLHDFRAAWTLNLSLARSVIEEIEHPFHPEIRPVYFEDLEFAYRCLGGAPAIVYEPRAIAVHDHRVSIGEYFRREVLLGMMSAVLCETNRRCFDALFTTEPRAHAQGARPMLDLDTPDHRRLLAYFVEQAETRIDPLGDQHDAASRLFVSHLPLKRRAFRLGLIAQLDERLAWDQRVPRAAEVLSEDAVFSGLGSPANQAHEKRPMRTAPGVQSG
ncbi:MAG: glycosyltransferase [Phycisphaerales bacterium]|nr:glycosyltransferase [Phycisphaerales bacterium]